MKLELDDPQLKSLVQEAILKSLDEKKRDTLLAGAIAKLLEPASKDYYSETNLQRIFNDALYAVARDIVKKDMEGNEEITGKVRELMNAALAKLMELKRDETINKMTDAFTKGLFGDRY